MPSQGVSAPGATSQLFWTQGAATVLDKQGQLPPQTHTEGMANPSVRPSLLLSEA